MLSVLLKHRPVSPVTSEMVFNSGSESTDLSEAQDREMMQLLIDHQEDLVITEDIVLAVLTSPLKPSGYKLPDAAFRVLDSLFERNPHLKVSEAMLETTEESDDVEILLQRKSLEGQEAGS